MTRRSERDQHRAVGERGVQPGGKLLLVRRSDNRNWALPGGAVDIGDSLPRAAVQETREESGIEREVTGLSGVYTDPGHVILQRAAGSSEMSEARWVPPVEVGGYRMDLSMRQRVQHRCRGTTVRTWVYERAACSALLLIGMIAIVRVGA